MKLISGLASAVTAMLMTANFDAVQALEELERREAAFRRHGVMRYGVRKHGSYRAHQRAKVKAHNRRTNAQRHA